MKHKMVATVMGAVLAVVVPAAMLIPLRTYKSGNSVALGPRAERRLKDPPPGTCCYFQLRANETRSLVSNMALVRLGDSKEDVVRRIGNPDFQTNINSQGLFVLRPKAVLWGYWVKRWKDVPNDEFDRSVVLFFDTNDHLVRVDSYFEQVKDLP
ncbi:MAG TPA: hypothetical protein VK738_04545 [Terriglobales bacterium]|jgi:hypothetical protein|nr:hypothetical protein [Terriglobales bacterium]